MTLASAPRRVRRAAEPRPQGQLGDAGAGHRRRRLGVGAGRDVRLPGAHVLRRRRPGEEDQLGPASAFYSCIPAGMRGPTRIVWASLTPVSLQITMLNKGLAMGDAVKCARPPTRCNSLPDPERTSVSQAYSRKILLPPSRCGIPSPSLASRWEWNPGSHSVPHSYPDKARPTAHRCSRRAPSA